MKALDKEILRLAIPSILANITVPLVGMVDIAVAGHLHSAIPGSLAPAASGSAAAFIGGISVGALLLNVIYWNFFFIRASTGGLTAQAFGRRNAESGMKHEVDDEQKPDGRGRSFLRGPARGGSGCPQPSASAPTPGSLLIHSVALAFGFAALLLGLQWPLSRLAYLFADRTPAVAELAIRYFFIRVWAAPATLSLMAIKGWFIGMQDTVSSMFTDLIVNVVNIVASIVLTLGLGSWQGIGFDGIALGTVVAQYCGLAFAAAVIAIKYRSEFTAVATEHDGCQPATADAVFCEGPRVAVADVSGRPAGSNRLSAAGFRPFFALNCDLFIRSLCFTGIYLGYTVIAAQYGEVLLATSNIMMTLMMLFSYFTDGFAYAGEALTGRFIGERDRKMTLQSIGGTFKWSFAIAGVWMLIYILAGDPLLRIMTDDTTVLDACRCFLPWLIVMPPLGCAAFAWDGIYVGATASLPIRNGMILALAAFYGCWYLGRAFIPGSAPVAEPAPWQASVPAIHLLLAAYFAHIVARTVYLTIGFRHRIMDR